MSRGAAFGLWKTRVIEVLCGRAPSGFGSDCTVKVFGPSDWPKLPAPLEDWMRDAK